MFIVASTELVWYYRFAVLTARRNFGASHRISKEIVARRKPRMVQGFGKLPRAAGSTELFGESHRDANVRLPKLAGLSDACCVPLCSGGATESPANQHKGSMPDFPIPKPRPKSPICSAEWHLQQHPLALATYTKMGALTYGGQNTYFTDTEWMASYFGRTTDVMRRVFSKLDHAGWIVVLHPDNPLTIIRTKYNVKIRQWVSHEQWVATHPGKCFKETETFHWSMGADKLCAQIFAVLEGQIRLHENDLVAVRKLPIPEKYFLDQLAANWVDAKARKAAKDFDRTSAKAVFYDTLRFCKDTEPAFLG